MRVRFTAVAAFILVGWLLAASTPFAQQPPVQRQPQQPLLPQQQIPSANKVQPRLEAIAETKLIMEGLAQSNFRGLDRILRERPKDAQSWTFARGQALLLAETANLLMLRPPKNAGEPVWFQRTMEFRTLAVELAQTMGQKDYDRGKALLVSMANTCNRCHQTFRVPVQITPFEEQPLPKVHFRPSDVVGDAIRGVP